MKISEFKIDSRELKIINLYTHGFYRENYDFDNYDFRNSFELFMCKWLIERKLYLGSKLSESILDKYDSCFRKFFVRDSLQ